MEGKSSAWFQLLTEFGPNVLERIRPSLPGSGASQRALKTIYALTSIRGAGSFSDSQPVLFHIGEHLRQDLLGQVGHVVVDYLVEAGIRGRGDTNARPWDDPG
jgi:hypothetical protein